MVLMDAADAPGAEGAIPPLVDIGSFTHGVCGDCDWRGPARRSRRVASEDAELHHMTCADAGVQARPESVSVSEDERLRLSTPGAGR